MMATGPPQHLKALREETHTKEHTDKYGDGIEMLRQDVAKMAKKKGHSAKV